MPRGAEFDCLASGQSREKENLESHFRVKQNWYKHNKKSLWNNNIGPIQERIVSICQRKTDLSRKLTDFHFCRRLLPRRESASVPAPKVFCTQSPTFPSHHYLNDLPATNMIPPSPEQRSLLVLGISHDGFGTFGYLQNRYDSGLPETRYYYPPTTNSAYAWKLLDSISSQRNLIIPRRTGTRHFYRVNGAVTEMDYAAFRYP